jgi:hypothetical protein
MFAVNVGRRSLTFAAAVLAFGTGMPRVAQGHCDTLDGPVVTAARAALEAGDITPVLMWIKSEYEPELRSTFSEVLALRGKDAQVRDFADRYFFETLVRLHRSGEGAPYTGLKPAGALLDPAVAAADRSLETQAVDELVKLVTGAVERGIRARFGTALQARQHVQHNVEAGRVFVAAYVDYVHYAERLYTDAQSAPMHGSDAHNEAQHAEPQH